MQELKADTGVKVKVGPIVGATSASSPGITPVTNLTIGGADDVGFLKHDATGITSTATANAFDPIVNADGYYNLTLTTGNVDTEGMLEFFIHDDSLIVPHREKFMVVNAPYYSSKYGTSSATALQVDVIDKTGFSLSATGYGSVWTSGTRTLTTATNLTVNDLTTKTGFELTATGYDSVWTSVTRILTSATALTVDTVTNVTDKAGYNLTATGYESVWTRGTRTLTTATNTTIGLTADAIDAVWTATDRTLTSATGLTVLDITTKTGYAISATGITDIEQGVWGASGVRSLTTATNLTVNDLTTKTGFELTATGYDSVWTSGTRTLTTATNTTIGLTADAADVVWAATARTLTTATNLTVLDVTSGVSVQTGGFPVGGFAAGAITDAAISSAAEVQIATVVLNQQVESKGAITLRQFGSIVLSAVAGETASGGAKFYNPTGGTVRISAVVSATANERTSITLTPST